MRIFEDVLFLQATYNINTEKQTINLLSLRQFDAGMLAEGKGHETDVIKKRAWRKVYDFTCKGVNYAPVPSSDGYTQIW